MSTTDTSCLPAMPGRGDRYHDASTATVWQYVESEWIVVNDDDVILARVFRRYLADDTEYAMLQGGSLCLDGHVSLSPEEREAIHRAGASIDF